MEVGPKLGVTAEDLRKLGRQLLAETTISTYDDVKSWSSKSLSKPEHGSIFRLLHPSTPRSFLDAVEESLEVADRYAKKTVSTGILSALKIKRITEPRDFSDSEWKHEVWTSYNARPRHRKDETKRDHQMGLVALLDIMVVAIQQERENAVAIDEIMNEAQKAPIPDCLDVHQNHNPMLHLGRLRLLTRYVRRYAGKSVTDLCCEIKKPAAQNRLAKIPLSYRLAFLESLGEHTHADNKSLAEHLRLGNAIVRHLTNETLPPQAKIQALKFCVKTQRSGNHIARKKHATDVRVAYKNLDFSIHKLSDSLTGNEGLPELPRRKAKARDALPTT